MIKLNFKRRIFKMKLERQIIKLNLKSFIKIVIVNNHFLTNVIVEFILINIDFNARKIYFNIKLINKESELKIFIVFDLRAKDLTLNIRALRLHFRAIIIFYYFQ